MTILIVAIIYLFISGQEIEMEENKSQNSLDDNKNTQNESDIGTEKSEKVIVTYKGNKYDITDFVKKHPGGKEVLLENNGNDIEKLMQENEHSEYAYKLLEKYRVQ